MDCVRCAAHNEDVRKFCRSCGSPLGRFCDRCGTVNMYDDKFCGVCGFPLVPSLKKDLDPRSAASYTFLGMPRQYDADEVEELLALRKKLNPGKKTSVTLSQDDIDSVFG